MSILFLSFNHHHDKQQQNSHQHHHHYDLRDHLGHEHPSLHYHRHCDFLHHQHGQHQHEGLPPSPRDHRHYRPRRHYHLDFSETCGNSVKSHQSSLEVFILSIGMSVSFQHLFCFIFVCFFFAHQIPFSSISGEKTRIKLMSQS